MKTLSVRMLVLAGLLVVLLASPGTVAAQTDSRGLDPVLLISGLKVRVISLELEPDLTFSLLTKLDTSLAALESRNAEAVIGPLRAFQNEVQAHRGVQSPIFIYTADSLVGQAEIIIEGIADPGFLQVADPNNLFYLGGTVLQHPKVYLTFWNWGARHSDPDGEIPDLQGFLQGIGGTPYLEPMTQYYMNDPAAPGGKGYISNDDNLLKGVWYDDVHPMPYFTLHQGGTDTQVFYADTPDIEKEVRESVKHFGFDPDAIYFIATPPKREWMGDSSVCAYHSSTSALQFFSISVAYVDFPYQPPAAALYPMVLRSPQSSRFTNSSKR